MSVSLDLISGMPTQLALLGVTQLEVLILELVAVDGLSASACTLSIMQSNILIEVHKPSPLVKSPP